MILCSAWYARVLEAALLALGVLLLAVFVDANSTCNESSVHWCIRAASLFHVPRRDAQDPAGYTRADALGVVGVNLLGDGDVLTESCELSNDAISLHLDTARRGGYASSNARTVGLGNASWQSSAQSILVMPPIAQVTPVAPAHMMPMIARSAPVTQLGDEDMHEMVSLGSIEVPIRFSEDNDNNTRSSHSDSSVVHDGARKTANTSALVTASPQQPPSPVPTVLHLMVGMTAHEDVCYEISLFGSLDDVHSPSRAQLHLISTAPALYSSSPSTAPSCKVRLAAYLDNQQSRRTSSVSTSQSSATPRSSASCSCQLATVEKFTYTLPEELLRTVAAPANCSSTAAVLTLYATMRVLAPRSVLVGTNDKNSNNDVSGGRARSSDMTGTPTAAMIKLLAVTVGKDEDKNTTYYYYGNGTRRQTDRVNVDVRDGLAAGQRYAHNVHERARRGASDVRANLLPAQRCSTLTLAKDFGHMADYVQCTSVNKDDGLGNTLLYLVVLACSSMLALGISARILRARN